MHGVMVVKWDNWPVGYQRLSKFHSENIESVYNYLVKVNLRVTVQVTLCEGAIFSTSTSLSENICLVNTLASWPPLCRLGTIIFMDCCLHFVGGDCFIVGAHILSLET